MPRSHAAVCFVVFVVSGCPQAPTEEDEQPCRTVVDARVSVAADVAELADVCTIDGLLLVEAGAVASLSLPRLKSVGGLDVRGDVSVNLPALTIVGDDGVLVASEAAVAAFTVPLLDRVGGDLRLDGNFDVDLPRVTEIDGSVTVLGSTNVDAVAGFSAPRLLGVGGNLTLIARDVDGVDRVEMPALRDVGGSVSVEASVDLGIFEAPALRTVGGDLALLGQADVSLPQLTTVGGGFDPQTNGVVTTLSLPLLESVGALFNVSPQSPGLVTLSVPVLASVGGLTVFNTDVANLSLPALVDVGADGILINATRSVTLRLPVLATVAGDLTVDTNPNLTDIVAPGLLTVDGAVDISLNPLLTSCSGAPIVGIGDCP